MLITSRQNQWFRFIRSLMETNNKTDQFVVEGVKNVIEAVHAGIKIDHLCMSESYAKDPSSHLQQVQNQTVHVFKDELFGRLADTMHPQGLLAVLAKSSIQSLPTPLPKGVYAVLENIGDPGNMGTMIRTAHAAQLNGLILCDHCTDPFSPKSVRAATGGLFHVGLSFMPHVKDVLSLCSRSGIRTCALSVHAKQSIYDINAREDIAFFVGNEASGLSRSAVKGCDLEASIPMPGGSESINAAVALALAVYETVRLKTTNE